MNPVETLVSEEPSTEDSTHSFFPTVAVIEDSIEASTLRPQTHTFVPFIPGVLPEATSNSALTVEPPSMVAVEEESTGDDADEGSNPEVETEQEEEAEPEVEEIPPTEDESGEQMTGGKASYGIQHFKQ